MSKTTLNDLASLLSLNKSTVSRALSNHPDISPKTKQRLLDAAKSFNYIPNLQARFFRKKNSNLIALILPEHNMFFIPTLIQTIQTHAAYDGKQLLVFFSKNAYENEKFLVNLCLSWMVEGVFISLSNDTNTIDHLLPLHQNNIKVVLLDKVISNHTFPSICLDDSIATEKATSFLLQNNAQRILGVFGNKEMLMSKNRSQGFKHVIALYIKKTQMKISFHILHVDNPSELGKINDDFYKQFDAFLFMSDELFAHAYYPITSSILDKNLINWITISDGTTPSLFDPSMAYVYHSAEELGIKAYNLFKNYNYNNPEITLIKPQLIIK